MATHPTLNLSALLSSNESGRQLSQKLSTSTAHIERFIASVVLVLHGKEEAEDWTVWHALFFKDFLLPAAAKMGQGEEYAMREFLRLLSIIVVPPFPVDPRVARIFKTGRDFLATLEDVLDVRSVVWHLLESNAFGDVGRHTVEWAKESDVKLSNVPRLSQPPFMQLWKTTLEMDDFLADLQHTFERVGPLSVTYPHPGPSTIAPSIAPPPSSPPSSDIEPSSAVAEEQDEAREIKASEIEATGVQTVVGSDEQLAEQKMKEWKDSEQSVSVQVVTAQGAETEKLEAAEQENEAPTRHSVPSPFATPSRSAPSLAGAAVLEEAAAVSPSPSSPSPSLPRSLPGSHTRPPTLLLSPADSPLAGGTGQDVVEDEKLPEKEVASLSPSLSHCSLSSPAGRPSLHSPPSSHPSTTPATPTANPGSFVLAPISPASPLASLDPPSPSSVSALESPSKSVEEYVKMLGGVNSGGKVMETREVQDVEELGKDASSSRTVETGPQSSEEGSSGALQLEKNDLKANGSATPTSSLAHTPSPVSSRSSRLVEQATPSPSPKIVHQSSLFPSPSWSGSVASSPSRSYAGDEPSEAQDAAALMAIHGRNPHLLPLYLEANEDILDPLLAHCIAARSSIAGMFSVGGAVYGNVESEEVKKVVMSQLLRREGVPDCIDTILMRSMKAGYVSSDGLLAVVKSRSGDRVRTESDVWISPEAPALRRTLAGKTDDKGELFQSSSINGSFIADLVETLVDAIKAPASHPPSALLNKLHQLESIFKRRNSADSSFTTVAEQIALIRSLLSRTVTVTAMVDDAITEAMQTGASFLQDLSLSIACSIIATGGNLDDYVELLFHLADQASPNGVGKGGVPPYSWFEYMGVVVAKALGDESALLKEVVNEGWEEQEGEDGKEGEVGEEGYTTRPPFAASDDSSSHCKPSLETLVTVDTFPHFYRDYYSKSVGEDASLARDAFKKTFEGVKEILSVRIEASLGKPGFLEILLYQLDPTRFKEPSNAEINDLSDSAPLAANLFQVVAAADPALSPAEKLSAVAALLKKVKKGKKAVRRLIGGGRKKVGVVEKGGQAGEGSA